MTTNVPLSRQVFLLQRHIQGLPESTENDPGFAAILDWVREVPPAGRPKEFLELLAKKFHITEEHLEKLLSPKSRQKDFDDLIPRSGWLRDYIEYTRKTEPPTVFHFFVGATTIGSALARNVRFDKGSYFVFPNLCVILVAPSGKCRKTSACSIGVSLYRSLGGNIIADKTTPEALVEAFRDEATTCGLLYAPELAVFLGKQKYQEGMVPMLTSLFDCPAEWSSKTIGRGDIVLKSVALSLLGASTLDWIQTAIPKDAFGGGFMSRLLFVVQHDTPRSFALPPPLDDKSRTSLLRELINIAKFRGMAKLTNDGKEWYEDWYNHRSDRNTEDKQFAGYYERKPDHLLRLAIILGVSSGLSLDLDSATLERALAILDWTESYLPATFDSMAQNAVGEDLSRLMKQIKNKGGQLDHSSWLRMNSNKMNARQFRDNVETLRMAKLIEYDQAQKMYYVTPEGFK